jgi:hypothetical protein
MFDGRVLILSAIGETLDGVQAYLSGLGATALSLARIEDARSIATESDALLLFADDYPHGDVAHVLASFPTKRCVVVTSDVETHQAVDRSRDGHLKLVVLRRPAWGGVLLHALCSDRTPDHE